MGNDPHPCGVQTALQRERPPLGVPPRFSPGEVPVPRAQRQAMFPATWPERLILYGRSNRGAETIGCSTGVTRAGLSQSSEAPRAPVIVPADMMPKPPGREADEASPAGTALAPPSGVTGRRPSG